MRSIPQKLGGRNRWGRRYVRRVLLINLAAAVTAREQVAAHSASWAPIGQPDLSVA